MTVIQMSGQELTRLPIMIDLADGRITVEAAAALMGLGRRQVFRLRRAFATDGASALSSRKRGRPSNRQHGETFRRTVLALVRQHYADFGPTFAAEKLASCHVLRLRPTAAAEVLDPYQCNPLTFVSIIEALPNLGAS